MSGRECLIDPVATLFPSRAERERLDDKLTRDLPSANERIAAGSVVPTLDFDAFRVELSLRRFFEAPTIAGLGSVIEDMLVREIRELSSEEAERLAGDAELLAKERS